MLFGRGYYGERGGRKKRWKGRVTGAEADCCCKSITLLSSNNQSLKQVIRKEAKMEAGKEAGVEILGTVALTLLLGCLENIAQSWGGVADRMVRLCWELLAELSRLSHNSLHSSVVAEECWTLTSCRDRI